MDVLFERLPVLVEIRAFFELGGDVLFLIALVTFVMWVLIFERFVYLTTTHPRIYAATLSAWEGREERHSWFAHQIREQLVSSAAQSLERNMALIKTCVAICPLMGLLGTVTGMVEVFEVMSISGSANPRSMAAGVSKATIPTMAGMVAALSGVAMSAYLQSRVTRGRALLNEHLTMDH